MIAKSLAVALATCVTLALTPTPAEAGHRRSGLNADLNFFVGGHAFPYGRHARFYGPGVVVNPFIFPDGRVSLNYLYGGSLFATDYIGLIDYGRGGRVRGFYTYDGGYYDNRGRFYRDFHRNYRRYGFDNSYRRGYHYGNGYYGRDGRYYRRYDDNYFGRDDRRDRRWDGRDDRRDDRDDRRNDRDDRRDDRYDDDRDFRNEPYRGGGVPPGGIQSHEFPGPSDYQRIPSIYESAPRSGDLDDQLDG
ncbi:MAG: hypothetical protein AAF608_13750 [Pseudomonadota bacterium]